MSYDMRNGDQAFRQRPFPKLWLATEFAPSLVDPVPTLDCSLFLRLARACVSLEIYDIGKYMAHTTSNVQSQGKVCYPNAGQKRRPKVAPKHYSSTGMTAECCRRACFSG